jgi:fermentation-respiration switch protein FrsA (DUF1100 family)
MDAMMGTSEPLPQALLDRVAADRRRRALDGVSDSIGPFEVIRLDPVTREYVERVLYEEPGFGSEVTLESVDLLLRFRPEDAVHRLAPRPLLLVHGADNRLHSPDEARELHRRAGEPKELVLLEGVGHTEWMADDDEAFLRLGTLVRKFLQESL